MESDPKSVNATDKLKKKQDHNRPEDLIDDRNIKLKDLHKDSLYPQYHIEKVVREANLEESNRANVDGFRVHSKGRGRDDFLSETSKRPRITTPHSSSDSALKPVELVEEIVRIYSNYIDHIFVMAKDRHKDEARWNFDKSMCSGLAETFSQKIERLEYELQRMKNDKNQVKNHSFIEPRLRQIMAQLLKMHDRFERSPNITACSKKNCTKEELLLCINEIEQMKKELNAITSGIRELKTMKMQKGRMEIKQRNLRII